MPEDSSTDHTFRPKPIPFYKRLCATGREAPSTPMNRPGIQTIFETLEYPQ